MRPLLLLALVVVSTHEALGQRVTASVTAGVAVTTFESDADFDPGATVGGGFGLGYDTGRSVSAHVDLLYLIKAASTELLLDGIPSRVRFQYTDVEIPVYVAVRPPVYWRVVPLVLGGASVAFNRDARLRYRAVAGGPSFDATDPDARARTHSLLLGLGAETSFGTDRLFVHARVHVGRSDVREQTGGLRSRTFFLAAGFSF